MELIVLFVIGVILIYAVNKYTKSKLCPKCNSKKITRTLELGHNKDEIIKYIKEERTRYLPSGGARYEYKCSDCGEIWHKEINDSRKKQSIYSQVVVKYEKELEEKRILEIEKTHKDWLKKEKEKKYYKIK